MKRSAPATTERAGERLRLRDGRQLGYAEFGDPEGSAVFFLHGWGDSRLTRHPNDTATAAQGIRLITIDRPGAGLSDFVPGRCLLDCPDDVAAVADALDIESFTVFGWSGGGPHAAACAFALPERVNSLGLVCGFAPLDGPNRSRGLPVDLRLGIPLLRRMPWVARLFFAGTPRQFARDPQRAFDRHFARRLPACDQEVLSNPAVRVNLEQGAAEALRQGARGFAYELGLLFARPWEFDPREITVPTHLWSGTHDPLVPLWMGQRLANEIPRSHRKVVQGEGHLLLFTHWEEILEELTRRHRRRRPFRAETPSANGARL